MKDTQDVSNVALQSIIAYAQKNRGTAKELTDRISQIVGRKMHRQVIESWINPDPARRVEPKLGIGIILLSESRKLVHGAAAPLDMVKTIRKAKWAV